MTRQEQISKLLELYNDYSRDEFLSKEDLTESSLETNKTLGLLYTNVGDNEEYEIQVSYDVEKERLSVSLYNTETQEGYLYSEKESLEQIIDELGYMDFNDWYSYAHNIIENKLGKTEIDF